MRQNKDIQYASLLENFQIGNILKSYFDLLKSHFLSNLNVNLFNDRWKQPPLQFLVTNYEMP
jgi:hypothetical protein